ncbi:MAG: HAD-IA family hydrolase [Colwellia sp.]
MRFNKRLQTFKAISFDLDDTLYSNRPVMMAIEQKMIAYFAQIMPDKASIFDHDFWSSFRLNAIEKQPKLAHDVVLSRLVSYRLGFLSVGLSEQEADHQAQKALAYFIDCRSNFTVPEASVHLLESLSKKYPLIAISNGNVDTTKLGIDKYFSAVYHAGFQPDDTLFHQKPLTTMFEKGCLHLGIKPTELLHVGDCGRSDILGAHNAGCQTVWLSCYDVGQPISTLPHVELTDITQLNLL